MKKVVKITGMESLTKDLKSVYQELRAGELGISEAKELANVSGKIISSSKTQMEYNKMMGNKNKVDFLES